MLDQKGYEWKSKTYMIWVKRSNLWLCSHDHLPPTCQSRSWGSSRGPWRRRPRWVRGHWRSWWWLPGRPSACPSGTWWSPRQSCPVPHIGLNIFIMLGIGIPELLISQIWSLKDNFEPFLTNSHTHSCYHHLLVVLSQASHITSSTFVRKISFQVSNQIRLHHVVKLELSRIFENGWLQ